MSDIADIANDRVELELELSMKARRGRHVLVPAGQCHYCAEEVGSGALFCDTGCRDEYDREAAIRKRQGL